MEDIFLYHSQKVDTLSFFKFFSVYGVEKMSLEIPENVQKIIKPYPDMKAAPLYSSRGLNVYIDLIKTKYNFIDINELLSHANMKIEEIKDPGYWFNQYQMNAFMDYLIKKTGNSEIGREGGRFVCAPESLGQLRSYYLSFVSPLTVYKNLNKLMADFSLSASYESIIHSSNSVEIIVTPYPGVKEEKFQCDNRKGYFEGIFQLFNLTFPKIEHDKCLFHGDNVCRYIISWKPEKSKKYKLIQKRILLLSTVFLLSPFFISFPSALIIISLIALINSLFYSIISRIETKELRKIIMKKANDNSFSELFQMIQENYENIDMIRKLSIGLSKTYQLKGSLQSIIDILQTRYDRGAILLANANQTKLIYEVGYGYTEEQLDLWRQTGWFHILQESDGTFIRTFRENKSFLINDINTVINDYSLRSSELAKKMGVKSLISCPIYYDNQPLGVLAVDNFMTKRELIQSDTNLLMGVANQISIRIQYYKMAAKEKNAAMVDMAMQAVHNIRNPSNAIDTNLSYIQKFCKYDEKCSQKLTHIQSQNSRVLELAKDFLRYTKPVDLRKTTINFNFLIKEMVSSIDDKDKLLKLEVSNPIINADKSELKWIFEELIENSKRYGEMPLEIEVKTDKNMLQIFFKDNGNGIPDEHKDYIFEPFFAANKQSSGLGLSNIQRIIKEHGGSIRLDNKETSGACFLIELPIGVEKNNE